MMVVIGAKIDEFSKAMYTVQQKMGTVGKGMQQVGGSMTKYITVPMVAAAGALLGGAVKAGIFADELLDLSAVTGVSTDQLQRWRYMAVDAGTSSDAVADALSRMNRQMVEGTEFGAKLERTAEGYGVALRDANGNVRDGTDVITDLMIAIAGIEDPAERARAGAQAFGRDWTTIAPIVDLGTEAIQKWNQQDVIDREKLEQMNAFRQEWDGLKNDLSMAFMEIVGEYIPILTEFVGTLKDKLQPVVERIIEKIGEWMEKWQNLSPEMQKIIGVILAVVAGAGPLLTIIGSILVFMSLISGAAIILFAKIIIIIAIIALVVAAIKHLWETNEGFRDAVIAIWEGIKAAALAIWGALQDFWAEHGAMIMEALGAVWEFIKTAWETVWGIISAVAMAVFGALQAFWEQWGETIIAVFGAVWEQVKNIFTTVVTIITNMFKLFTALLKGDWTGAWEAIKAIGQAAWDFIKNSVDNLRTALSAIWDGILTYVKQIWENIKTAVTQKVTEVRQTIENKLNEAWEYIKGIPAQAVGWGRDIIDGLIQGITNAASRVWTAVKNIIQTYITDPIKDFFGISSPSKLMAGFGEDIAKGLAIGMDSMTGVVAGAANTMSGAANISGGDTKNVSINMAGLFSGANVNIGSEQDAKSLARELYKLTASSARVQGVMI